MYKINIGKVYPVHGTDMHQARVFINDDSYKPTAPIGTIIRDLTKTTHKYTFTSKGGKKMWAGSLPSLKNTILERYIQAMHTQPTTEEFNNLSDEIYYNESIDDIMSDEAANAIADAEADGVHIPITPSEQYTASQVRVARDNTLSMAV